MRYRIRIQQIGEESAVQGGTKNGPKTDGIRDEQIGGRDKKNGSGGLRQKSPKYC